MKDNRNNKAKIYMIFSLIVLVIVVIVSGTYAYYVWTTSDSDTTKIVAGIGAATVTFDGGSDINANLRPVSDKSKGIIKNISVKGDTTGLVFNMYLDITSIDTGLKDKSFRYELYKGTTKVKEGNFSDSYLTSNTVTCSKNNTNHIVLLTNESISTSKTSYTLYIWIDGANYTNPNTMMNKTFSFKLHADGEGAVLNTPLGNAVEYITNLYTNAEKEIVTNNSITYNTAPLVSLIGDRFGGNATKEGKAWQTSNNPTNNPFTSEEECLNYVNTNYRYYINNITCSSDWENNGFESETACNEAKTEEKIKENVKNFQQEMCLNSAGEFPDYTGGNIRYYGASPDNYIYFNCDTYPDTNCELWRIIGVFDGKLKLIRSSRIGGLAWDYDKNDDSSKTAYDNDWSTATLQKLLNGSYYNGSGTVTYYSNSAGIRRTSLNMTSIGIKNEVTRKVIAETTYYLGGWNSSSVYPNQIYEYERGTTVYTGNLALWTGKIALAYPSDYGYAADFNKCKDKILLDYGDSTCTSNNWMKAIITNNGSEAGWLLTPNPNHLSYAWYVNSSSIVGYSNNTQNACWATPVLYLNSDIRLESGDGSSSNPYKLSV